MCGRHVWGGKFGKNRFETRTIQKKDSDFRKTAKRRWALRLCEGIRDDSLSWETKCGQWWGAADAPSKNVPLTGVKVRRDLGNIPDYGLVERG